MHKIGLVRASYNVISKLRVERPVGFEFSYRRYARAVMCCNGAENRTREGNCLAAVFSWLCDGFKWALFCCRHEADRTVACVWRTRSLLQLPRPNCVPAHHTQCVRVQAGDCATFKRSVPHQTLLRRRSVLRFPGRAVPRADLWRGVPRTVPGHHTAW
jgi:hypothetical protein